MTNNAEHHNWVLEDLRKSGLTVHNFTIEPLRNENELKERLGFPVFGAIKIGRRIYFDPDEISSWISKHKIPARENDK